MASMEFEFDGECTIERADEIRQSLLNTIDKNDHISLRFARVEYADLTFFQLLGAVIRTCDAAGKTLEMKNDLPAKLTLNARMTGFAHIVEASE